MNFYRKMMQYGVRGGLTIRITLVIRPHHFYHLNFRHFARDIMFKRRFNALAIHFVEIPKAYKSLGRMCYLHSFHPLICGYRHT